MLMNKSWTKTKVLLAVTVIVVAAAAIQNVQPHRQELDEFKQILHSSSKKDIVRVDHYGCNIWVVKLRSGRELHLDVPENERDQLYKESSAGLRLRHHAIDDFTFVAVVAVMLPVSFAIGMCWCTIRMLSKKRRQPRILGCGKHQTCPASIT